MGAPSRNSRNFRNTDAWFSTKLLSRLSSQRAAQNQETMESNVGPALNGDMVATGVVKVSLKFESWDPLRGFQRNC